jgi:hypothetical protein
MQSSSDRGDSGLLTDTNAEVPGYSRARVGSVLWWIETRAVASTTFDLVCTHPGRLQVSSTSNRPVRLRYDREDDPTGDSLHRRSRVGRQHGVIPAHHVADHTGGGRLPGVRDRVGHSGARRQAPDEDASEEDH